MCLLKCVRLKIVCIILKIDQDLHLIVSNFVCLSSKLRILGFRNNWMENRCRVVLKRCLKVIDRNACALSWLTKLTKVIGRHELCTVMKGFYKRRRLLAKKNWGKKHFFDTFWSQNACQAFVHLFIFHLMYYVETAGLVYSFKIWNFFFFKWKHREVRVLKYFYLR